MNTPIPFLRKLALNCTHNFEFYMKIFKPWQIIKMSTFPLEIRSSLACFFCKISK